MIRTSMARVMLAMAGAAAVVGLLALSTEGRAPLARALQSVGAANRGDTIDGGLRIVPPSATSASPDEATPDGVGGTSRTDLEGDEVSPALATYGIDREGNLFEVHSPQTEVPRLAGPTI